MGSEMCIRDSLKAPCLDFHEAPCLLSFKKLYVLDDDGALVDDE